MFTRSLQNVIINMKLFTYKIIVMNLDKQHAKLIKLQTKAESCISRDEAQKIIRKAEKTQTKISG